MEGREEEWRMIVYVYLKPISHRLSLCLRQSSHVALRVRIVGRHVL